MAIDNRIGKKVAKNLRREEAPNTRVDPFPYIGIVKNNLDPSRSGRLQVWIPDLGGIEDDSKNWRTVSYASPFSGHTTQKQKSTDPDPSTNTFSTVEHTYGMWMVPPDIGVQVIVLFVAGDPLRGYWLACINDNLSHYMIPGLAGSSEVDTTSAPTPSGYSKGDIVPVVEFNENTSDFTSQTFYNSLKPIHDYQYNILKTQGLEKDPIRGAISSSSQRESPSHVFGISTPGRPVNDPADTEDTIQAYLSGLQSGTIDPKYLTVKTRKGGHTFVMDDGSDVGVDQLIRLRTATGHQLLMNDSEDIIYIANADGDSWVEFSADGVMNFYAKGGFNVRSEGAINLHSDSDVNINSQNLNINTGNFTLNSSNSLLQQTALTLEATGVAAIKAVEFNVDSASTFSIKAGGKGVIDSGAGTQTDSGGGVSLNYNKKLVLNSLSDTTQSGTTWTSNPGVLSTIVTVAPTHEPFNRGQGQVFSAPISTGIQPSAYSGSVDATKNAQSTGIKNPATVQDLRNQPKCDCSVGNLTSDQLTAYFATIGKSESGGNYNTTNSIGFVGKYQFGYGALVDGGYVKSSCKSNAQLQNPNNWVGKNGLNSVQDWLNNGPEQESAMCAYTKRNYNSMVKIGAITTDLDPAGVAGMLAVAHLLGPGGAKKYRNGQNSADAYGTTGSTYFNKGQYAVAVLAPQMTTVDQG